MKSGLPATRFVVTLQDDSMATDGMPAGHCIICDTKRLPAFGKAVLVRDRLDQLYVRRYTQGKSPDSWLAVAPNPAFASFESKSDGLSLVAVVIGHIEPD